MPFKQPKRTDGSCTRLRPGHPNHVWSYDFVQDRTHDGRKCRMLNVVDEFTHECLAIRVNRKFKAIDVIYVLSALFILRGISGLIRSDSGPEFVANAVCGSRRSYSAREIALVTIGITLYVYPLSGYSFLLHVSLEATNLMVQKLSVCVLMAMAASPLSFAMAADANTVNNSVKFCVAQVHLQDDEPSQRFDAFYNPSTGRVENNATYDSDQEPLHRFEQCMATQG